MVMLKRLREIEESESEMDSIRTANFLVLLSRGDKDGGMVHPESSDTELVPPQPSASDRVFECKTCNRQFSSFQALGGHRTSHKKVRTIEDSDKQNSSSKRKSHECSICGLEFAMGQALGGHMRLHRNAVERFSDENKCGRNKALCLDVNSSSLDGEPIFLFGMVLGRKMSTVH